MLVSSAGPLVARAFAPCMRYALVDFEYDRRRPRGYPASAKVSEMLRMLQADGWQLVTKRGSQEYIDTAA